MWRRSRNVELDPHQNRSTTLHRPPLYTGRLDNPLLFPLLTPPPKAGGNSMDHSSLGGIQNAKEETIDTQRLYRFSAPSQNQKSPRQHRVGNYLDIIWLRHWNYNRHWITKQLNDNKEKNQHHQPNNTKSTHTGIKWQTEGISQHPLD